MQETLLDDLDEAQREAVATDAAPLCILAGAGSGKTRVLTRRIAYRLRQGSADRGHVLAVTFTRKAGGELRQRLWTLGVGGDVLAGTFHSLAYAQLRRHWAEHKVEPFSLLDRKFRLLLPAIRRVIDPLPPSV